MNKELWIKQWFFEVLAKVNSSQLQEMATDPFIFHMAGGRKYQVTHQEYLSFLAMWHQRFKNVQFQLTHILSDDNKLMASYQCHATYHGGWLRIPGKNQAVHMTGMMLFKLEDGMMTECWMEDSNFDLYQQLTHYLD
ncbi:nuclear transport factor 2 family protein [Photobacterium damselae]|nr:nuclear transport factor 2 family protein [Photobacterium damselae]